MSDQSVSPVSGQDPTPVKETRWDTLSASLFWAWNLIFLSFLLAGFIPVTLANLIRSVRNGWTPPIYLIFMTILALIPIGTIVLAVMAVRNRPRRVLFALGYVVEGPLMLVLMFRFFVIRQDTLVMAILMIAAGLGMLAFLWHLLNGGRLGGKPTGWLMLAGLGLLAGVALYVALIVLFYVPPLAAYLGRFLIEIPRNGFQFFRSLDWRSLGWVVFSVMGLILMLFTTTLVVGLPVAVPWLSLRAWVRRFAEFRQRRGLPAALSTLIPLILVAAAVGLTMRQPQRAVYDWLKTPPATPQQAQALLAKSDQIRTGLLNSYLASYRYFSAEGEVNHIRSMYADAFSADIETASTVQRVYEWVLSPLLYQPMQKPDGAAFATNVAFSRDQATAGQLYQKFFDEDIIKAERDEMVRAARATYSGAQAEAAWLAVDDREILLTRQEVNVTEHGDWAEVELYEVYANQTQRQQEVVYYFSLPESAVVTGLYLGNSPDRAKRFTYRVAPRGAAQAVYRNEIRLRMDPALIEQIGPRQYRLRIFPVEPILFEMTPSMKGTSITNAPPLYMWLTYQTLAVENAWPLPALAEKRNVYWDEKTARLVNGEPSPAGPREWLPVSVPASGPITPAEHRVSFPGGQTVTVRPLSTVQLPTLPSGLRLAVVLDRSRSMNEQAGQVRSALAGLRQQFGDRADVYLTSSSFRGEAPSRVGLAMLDPDQVLYFGGQNAAELLGQFEALQGDAHYDGVIVLTDGNGYEVGDPGIQLKTPNAPVWVVHLDGKYPLGYDDPTLDAINASGGGVTGSVEEALQRLSAGLSSANASVLDGYVWQVERGGASSAATGGDFSALAARRLILTELRSKPGQEASLATLDQMQALAKENSIVTPYSSMIVLVEDRQKTLLDEMEKSKDRFDREVEQVGETVPLGMMAGVPEPHEWVLIGLAGLLLGYVLWTRKRAAVPA